ncbi:hypothetical protein QA596_10825 [Balneolales bacterium ANBcel1]|nr:hypothetical protein [Balneolales bacterium ANBcel1]
MKNTKFKMKVPLFFGIAFSCYNQQRKLLFLLIVTRADHHVSCRLISSGKSMPFPGPRRSKKRFRGEMNTFPSPGLLLLTQAKKRFPITNVQDYHFVCKRSQPKAVPVPDNGRHCHDVVDSKKRYFAAFSSELRRFFENRKKGKPLASRQAIQHPIIRFTMTSLYCG